MAFYPFSAIKALFWGYTEPNAFHFMFVVYIAIALMIKFWFCMIILLRKENITFLKKMLGVTSRTYAWSKPKNRYQCKTLNESD